MNKKIALVCEGATDQRFLEWLLYGLYGDDVSANPMQPSLDATDTGRFGAFGGWENVFAFFERPNAVDEVFSTNDYLIIQIDSDVCEHANFAVSLRAENGDKTVAQLVADIRERIIEKIGKETFEKYENKISFAICVHSLECWILPLYATNQVDFITTSTCENRLKIAFAKKKIKYVKDSRFYLKHTKIIKSNYDFCASKHESFRIFLNSLRENLKINCENNDD